ncbi:hypothetical protein FQA39_LY13312 [Lamprigera yunnana]|nr:hypothetical protein FQA39_LY13312 [Lamprigera yunnana]
MKLESLLIFIIFAVSQISSMEISCEETEYSTFSKHNKIITKFHTVSAARIIQSKKVRVLLKKLIDVQNNIDCLKMYIGQLADMYDNVWKCHYDNLQHTQILKMKTIEEVVQNIIELCRVCQNVSRDINCFQINVVPELQKFELDLEDMEQNLNTYENETSSCLNEIHLTASRLVTECFMV